MYGEISFRGYVVCSHRARVDNANGSCLITIVLADVSTSVLIAECTTP